MDDSGLGGEADCREALHELYSFLDGELTDERRHVIARHLDDCPPCGELGDFEVELRQLIARKCQESVPDDLRQRVASRLQRLAEEA